MNEPLIDGPSLLFLVFAAITCLSAVAVVVSQTVVCCRMNVCNPHGLLAGTVSGKHRSLVLSC